MAMAVEAEKLHMLAEERFLANDVAGALRVAREAQRLCPTSLTDVANALAAYEVHAVAATATGARDCWYAVLGVSPTSTTHEAIKQGYRRLCLALHPDKNRSVAADGAFKLVQEAWEVLSARHPPAPAAAPPMPASAAKPVNDIRPTPAASAYVSPVLTPRGGRKETGPFRAVYCRHGHWTLLQAVDEEVGVKCTVCGEWLGNPPSGPATSTATECARPPPPRSDSSRGDAGKFYSFTPRGGRKAPGPFRAGYCRHGHWTYQAVNEEFDAKCAVCGDWPGNPPYGAAAAAATECPPPRPPPRPDSSSSGDGGKFPCPMRCPSCSAEYASSLMVSVGRWRLQCPVCHKHALVHVRSPSHAHLL